MSVTMKPRVFISYTWRPAEVKAQAFDLAERLRSLDFDARIDMFFKDSLHGFSPPSRQPNESRDPWIVWAEREITSADCVLLLCTAQYAASDSGLAGPHGQWWNWRELPYGEQVASKVPFVWWDWARDDKGSPTSESTSHVNPHRLRTI